MYGLCFEDSVQQQEINDFNQIPYEYPYQRQVAAPNYRGHMAQILATSHNGEIRFLTDSH